MTAGMLLVAVVLLAGSQLGYAFYAKRDLQKTADLAALAGAKVVGTEGCGPATAAALANAEINKQGAFNATVVPTCHLWKGTLPVGSDGRPENIQHRFAPEPNTPNAVKVVVTGITPSFIPSLSAITQSAEAVATVDEPTASFSVGSSVARVGGDSVLGAALKAVGLNPAISLLSYDGLANVKITPGGLLGALGIPVTTDINVGQLNALLAVNQIGLGQLLDVAVTLAGQSELTGVNVALLNAIKANVGDIPLNVKLGSDTTPPRGLFASIVAPDATSGSALNTQISVLDIISTAIGVATSNHAVSVPGLSVLGNTITAKVGIVEPPSIGIGGVGATAYSAQVRAFVRLNTDNLPLLGGLLSNFVKLDLPLTLDVSSARGTISEMCTPDSRTANGAEGARIDVNAEVLKLCVGGMDENLLFSTSASCETHLQDKQLLKVGLLGVNLVDLTTKLHVRPLPSNGAVELAAGESGTVGNDLLLGTTVHDLTDALLAVLLGNSLKGGQGINSSANTILRRQTAVDLWGTTPCSTRSCRVERLADVRSRIEGASNGLTGFVGSLATNTLGIVGSLLTLDVLNLLGSVGGLVGGLLNLVGDLLGGLLGGCTALIGSNEPACIFEIENSLSGTSGSGSNQTPNVVLSLVSFLLQVLQPLLDKLGADVLTPILKNVLGLHLGETDVNMLSLKCDGAAKLVY